MTFKKALTFSINDSSKWLGVLALSLALAACGGGGGKKGGNRAVAGDQSDTDQPSTGEPGDLNGRWKVAYTMGPNPCYEKLTFNEEWDATQSGNKLTFRDANGNIAAEGTMSGNTLNFSEDNSDQENIYLSETTLVFDDATFSGEETFTCQPRAGGEAESGKAQYSGTKTSGPTPAKPGTPPPESTSSDDEPNNSVGQENQLKVGDVVHGTVNSATDDVDLYAMTTSSSATYEMSLTDFGGNNLDLAVFQVVGNEMQLLEASESGPGTDENIRLSGKNATQSKVYIVVFANDTAATTSNYSLRVTRQ